MKKPYTGSTGLHEDQCLSGNSAASKPMKKDGARQIKNQGMHVTHQLMVRQREMMANEFEQYYIGKGLLVEVELSGPDKTCISLLSSLFCKDSVYRIVEKTNLLSYLREAGFKKATLGDSDEKVWAYDLRTLWESRGMPLRK
jgi:hypothetical protein